ncbi:hypothetical protein BRADI_2g39097v3 [Brachypodium distachyon]|uniref:Uncharacterized protein n=1 Tax=Brachypodium distachyon TaxID=15368 RepID=A0A2K2DCS9_BRADI|nr:hypothetical protein BRADI_2g39097v3 [Brachypodium distachyon]
MEHLPSLQQVGVWLWPEKAAGGTSNECEEADAAVRLAADAHPNRPTLAIYHHSCPFKSYEDEEEEHADSGVVTGPGSTEKVS